MHMHLHTIMAGYAVVIYLVMMIMFASNGVESACNIDECPCLRYTYKMATYDNKCFQFYYGSKTWKEAKDYCVQQGGRLVTVNDPNTFQFIRSTLNSLAWKVTSIWIGAHDMTNELKWAWTNEHGEPDVPMTWSYWSPEHPGDWFHDLKDCVIMKNDNGRWRWHEAACHTYPFEYKFICEYDMKAPVADEPSSPNGAGGIFQSSYPSSNGVTTNPTSTNLHHGIVRHGSNHGEPPRGDHRKVTNMDGHMVSVLEGHANHEGKMGENTQDQEGHVPVYVVVIAFVCGTLFALAVVLFIIFRRRKRRKADNGNYLNVEYHAPGPDVVVPGNACMSAGAEGTTPVCEMTGKLCKVADDTGAEACACASGAEVRNQGRVSRKTATPNVYVSVEDVEKSQPPHGASRSTVRRSASDAPLSVTRVESPTDSSICSSINYLNEPPPTYDEACLGNVHEPTTTSTPAEGEGRYINEEPSTSNTSPRSSSTGTIPKTQHTVSTVEYLPMTGSNNNSPRVSLRSSHASDISSTKGDDGDNTDTSQYLPMSLGDLPPIPTDQGYEIPVSRRPNPEAVRQARNSITRPESTLSGEATVYSEIPDRASRSLYQDDEQIYSTID